MGHDFCEWAGDNKSQIYSNEKGWKTKENRNYYITQQKTFTNKNLMNNMKMDD